MAGNDTPLGPLAPESCVSVYGPLQSKAETEDGRTGPESEANEWHSADLPSRVQYLQHYIYYLTCVTIGGQEDYEGFLEQRVKLEDRDACAQVQARDVMRGVELYVSSRLNFMPMTSSIRMKSLCELIRGQKTMPINKCMFWTTCAITGATINNSLEICGVSPFHVCMSYAPFVWSFWVLTHIKELEEDRISHYMRENRNDFPITTLINDFKDSSHFASDRDIETYEKAISFVIDTLHVSTGISSEL